MPRIPIAALAVATCLSTLAGCGSSQSSSDNVSMRDMEVVDGTANDAMTDLDNVTIEGTRLENASAALANAGTVTNTSTPTATQQAPRIEAPSKKPDADAAE